MIPNASLDSHVENSDLRPLLPMADRKFITSFDPATGLHLATVVVDTAEDIANKINQAKEAQKNWKLTTFTQRRRVIRTLLKWLVDNQDVCARMACRDTGKTCELLVHFLVVDTEFDNLRVCVRVRVFTSSKK